ncbi:hypothetical protein BH23GEM9_BH23GEM9_00180 [soil metagenome]
MTQSPTCRVHAILPALLAIACTFSVRPAHAQQLLSEAAQVASAVAPLPAEFRENATVLGYRSATGRLVPLRNAAGPYLCLATNPAEEQRFHVACYHRSMEPFMARGRELRAQQALTPAQRDSIRNAESVSGRIKLPTVPAALYSLTGTWANVDRQTGAVQGASPLYVVYIPFATAESTGLPTTPMPNAPWLMFPGTPRAHIMFVPEM